MKTIVPPQQAVLRVLGPGCREGGQWRLCRYCHALAVEDGMLLYHVLTREMVLLSAAEWEAALTLPELRERWFVVPQDTRDSEHADLVRWALRAMKPRGPVTNFTILPTTDCNARCFYCYEAGRPRRMMSRETAEQTAAFIAGQCGGKAVRLSWFGGEPLMNPAAIDTICAALADAGIAYSSSMTTNGYLFSPEVVERAAGAWRLRSVQITLDGLEETYNRTKAYTGVDGSAFPTVLRNIGLLLSSGIHVAIRLNVGAHNVQEMQQLAELLCREFSGRSGLHVYPHLLFSTERWSGGADAQPEEQRPYAVQGQLAEQLSARGLHRPESLRRELPLTQCMADSGHARVILPDGRMTLCEHHTEDEIIGHIASPALDTALMQRWAEQEERREMCSGCVLYPECNRLKKCDALEKCNEDTLQAAIRSRERAMRNEYRRFQSGETKQEPPSAVRC